MNRTGSAMVQGRLWGRAAHDWAELQEPTALPLWEAMLDAATVGPGTHVLDAGCGAGGASLLAVGRGVYGNGLDATVQPLGAWGPRRARRAKRAADRRRGYGGVPG